jgi:serine/threonine protein kinase
MLLTDEKVLKIADFGLSRSVGARNYYRKTTEGMLPVRWMALECVLKSIYTPQSDLWSLGVVFWEIFT